MLDPNVTPGLAGTVERLRSLRGDELRDQLQHGSVRMGFNTVKHHEHLLLNAESLLVTAALNSPDLTLHTYKVVGEVTRLVQHSLLIGVGEAEEQRDPRQHFCFWRSAATSARGYRALS